MNASFLSVITLFLAAALPVHADPPKPKEIQSATGIVAKTVPSDASEGATDTQIFQHDKLVATIHNAAAVSFQPKGDILLLRETGADDDSRHFLLNLGKKEYSKNPEKRASWVIGGRYVVKTTWSDDGRQITLQTAQFAGGKPVTIEVKNFCR
ncbi:hypothetical protein JO972_10590 [Verrucomicrobiaceae bacterium 5K15]|uniref:Uncharacterized protein n=1 Tax=Oceaniferula flava TaxID=2800421 RepID=A0AAE2SEA8_9BACT|nr:hypothetical protein [Oceaniferula flavus]MBK1855407.1 hypothetical protein [Oceaniferula flavus]MBM1136713.1 hypothetical protein [Oceaniferula flavus]